MSTHILAIGAIASAIMAFIAFLSFLIKPLRERILGFSKHRTGNKYLVKYVIIQIYNNNVNKKILKLYEYEIISALYNEYKVTEKDPLIEKIYGEVQTWSVII